MSVYALSAETSDERFVPVSASSGIDRLSESLTIASGVELLRLSNASCADATNIAILDILKLKIGDVYDFPF